MNTCKFNSSLYGYSIIYYDAKFDWMMKGVTASCRREADNMMNGDIGRMNLPRKAENQRRDDTK